ncbi:MAG: caspase family protein, partial [Chlorobia bacterium]|nr:caspase family protein [Fimbriimonadaceae bacterium]
MPRLYQATLIASFALAVLPVVKADQAVVVGVQEYAPLVAASTLKGCVNDAQSIGEALRQQGFKVTLLINSQATRQAILDSLVKAQTSVKKEERFVFYFAGHGRKAPRFAIMPSDATISGVDLEPKDINDPIQKIPAKSRTILLDSCFSGGMAAGEMSKGLDGFTSRFFDGEQDRSIKFGPPKSQGSSSNKPEKFETASGICYYTASLDSEQALEANMDDGKRHGLFTYGLLKNLKAGKLWSEVHNDVKKQMGKRLENSGRTQNPMISTQFMPTNALDNVRKGAPKAPPGKTLLDIWNIDNPSPDKISFKIKPDQDIQEIGKQISLETKVGQDGYLVIFGQVGSKFYQFFPLDGSRGEDAKVRRGTIIFPTGRGRLFFDSFGADHLKAMLFATPEKAESVMAAMQSAGGQAKDVKLPKEVQDNPFTSRISVAVSDSLIGGSRLKELDILIKT